MNKLVLLDSAFGKALKKRRQFRNLTQETISLECGLSRSYISELELGKKDPSLFTIFKLAQALKIKPSVLLDEVEHSLEWKSSVSCINASSI